MTKKTEKGVAYFNRITGLISTCQKPRLNMMESIDVIRMGIRFNFHNIYLEVLHQLGTLTSYS